MDTDAIASRYARVRERIDAAARRCGRDATSVTLVVVTKTFGPEAVLAVTAAGACDIGENYVQEATRKMEALRSRHAAADTIPLRWHMIGTLQRNKAARAARLFDVIHTVDSEALARRLDDAARALGRRLPVLIEVNVAGERSKAGVPPASAAELVRAVAALRNLQLDGLTTVPPPGGDAEAARPHFRKLAALRDTLIRAGFDLPHLSMGMTGDYEVAIEEGATIVRVGRAILGERAGHQAEQAAGAPPPAGGPPAARPAGQARRDRPDRCQPSNTPAKSERNSRK